MSDRSEELEDADGYPIGRSTKYPGEFTSRPKGSPPPSGPGWTPIWTDKSKNWDYYHRGEPLPTGKKTTPVPPGKAPSSPTPGPPGKPPPPAPAPSSKTAPSASPGNRAVQAVEKDFSGDEDPDGFCLKCILRGMAKGALIAAATLAVLAAIIALLPEAIAAVVATWITKALFLLFVKGIMDLANNWGNMTWAQRQEAVGELAGGVAVGAGGAKLMPKPGALWPKGGFGAPEVGVTPDGVPMPVPDADPGVSSDPMKMTGPDEPGGGGGEQGGDPPPENPPKKKLSAKERRARDQEREANRRGGEMPEDGTPRSREGQQESWNDLRRGLNEEEAQKLHEKITKQNYPRDEIIKIRNDMFPNNPYPGSR
jgi:hypothetical protein